MRHLAIPAMLFAAAPVLAQAQATTDAQPPAPTTPAATASLDGNAPIASIAADPAGKAILEKDLPNLLTHPSYEQFKTMSLRQLAPYSGGALTEEEIAQVEADLKAVGK